MIEEVRLSDLITLQRGFDITKKDQKEGDIPVISSGGISSFHNEFKVEGPGVVIGRKGTLGTVFYNEGNFWPHDTSLWVKDFKGNEPKFIYYLLQVLHFEKFDAGAANPTLNRNHVHSLKLLVPKKQYRSTIASILSAYDDLIENNNQRIKLLEEMAEEIYKEWFVRMRFPGYQDCKFFDKEGNEVPQGTEGATPEGWEVRKLRDCLAHYIGGGWGEEFPKGKNIIPAHVIRGTDIPNFNLGKLNFEVLRYHTESNLSSRICEPNDIIFEVSGGTEDQSLGRTSFITRSALVRFDAPVIAASFCKLVRVDKNIISPYYINSMLNRMYSTGETKVFQVQSTGISNYQFEDFLDSTKVPVPEQSIQSQFEEIIAPMIDELHALGSKNQVLQETRDLLLPRLISGKLDVSKLAIKEPENLSMAAEPEGTYQMGNRTDAWQMIK
ncbi:restriction endonuclease subunit S [Algoriphagus halophytocola]|uniref:Restriction endonuclease subunit S n=1 Tax=Algoriphagus halophytocola TaxID=2991499 RepID=A0ABY6MJX2_9BACT|nr:restriction endonuclease subunit S [Algoriphagus sp. TR-M5]UZD23473.1 restriction endonuclease subunit S [Algoriphagus sp. TR-M5]